MGKVLLHVFLLFTAIAAQAQVASFHLIGVGAGNIGSANASQSFTIGELANGLYSNSDIAVSSNVYHQLILITSVDAEQLDNQVNFFPNPTRGEVTFLFEGEAPIEKKIEIYTPTTLVLNRENVSSSEIKINMSDYPDGIYLVRITERSNGTIRTIKIIKKRN